MSTRRKSGVLHKTHEIFPCLFCYYEAANERVLNLHYKLTHSVIRRNKTTIDIFSCKSCNKAVFSSEDRLLHHAKNCR